MNDPIEKLSRMSAPPPRPAARLAAKRAALEEFERVQAARAPESAPETDTSQGFWSLLRLSRTKDRSTGMKWVVSRAAFGGLASACVVAFSVVIMWPMFVNREQRTFESVASSEPESTIELRDRRSETVAPQSPAEPSSSVPDASSSARKSREFGPIVGEAASAAASATPSFDPNAPIIASGPMQPAKDEVDELTVTGTRVELQQSQMKRESTPVNAITPEDLGAVQDQNVAGAANLMAKMQAPSERARETKVKGALAARGNADGLANARMVPAPTSAANSYQPEGDDKFQKFDSNPIKQVTWALADRTSTFSVDVDTASYSFARRMINEGRLPQKDAVRVEEMINYFDYAWPAPESRKVPFEPTVAVSDSPWTKGKKLVHIGIKGYEIERSKVPDANLVLLLDVSGSMNSPDKLPLAVSSMELLLESLRPTDTVAIVVYAGAAGQVLAPTPVKDKDKILSALRSLTPGGSTAGAAGIELAYQLAEKNFRKGGVNRVILATDGDFNVGIHDTEELKGYVERKREKGIFLSVLGFGQGNYRDELSQALAQNGNGVAAYIDTINEAKKVLVNEATGSLFTIAKDVKIQVEFNPNTVAEYRLVGYETRSLRNEDFTNDKVDAGDVGSGHTVTAIYEITPVGSSAVSISPPRYMQTPEPTRVERNSRREYGFVRIRYKLPTENISDEASTPIPLETPDLSNDVKREVKFSTAVAGFGQLLRGGTYTGALTYEDIIESAQNAKGADRNGYRAEFLDLVRKAQKADGLQSSKKVTAPE